MKRREHEDPTEADGADHAWSRSLAYAVSGVAQEVFAGALVLAPNDLKWSESPRAPGVQAATLVGDPSKPGPYVIRAKYPPNTVNRPHHHRGLRRSPSCPVRCTSGVA